MSLERLHPFAGNHAIQSMAFALRWAEPLSVGQLETLRSRARTIDGYPHLSDRTQLSINLIGGHPAGPSPQVNPVEVNGFTLESAARRSDGASAVSIIVDKEETVIAFKEYSRWENISQNVKSLLPVFAGLDIDVPIIAIGLQFSDVFEWRGGWEDFKESDMFKIGNPYMAPNVFSLNQNWHSNHGFIDELDEPFTLKRINNINVSRETRKSRRLIKITTSHQLRFKEFVVEWATANQNKLWMCWDGAHEKNKSILKSLLSDDVLQKIALK